MATEPAVLRTAMEVHYITRADGKDTDISLDVSADLLSVTYNDKIDDEADDLSLTLKDETGKWAGTWSPDRGDFIRVVFTAQTGRFVDTGRMSIDRLRTSGRPRVFEIGAVNIPLDNTIRRTAKTRSCENTSLKEIAARIADGNGLDFKWDCADNPEYDRTEQKEESDLAYLKKLCNEAGYSVKVYDSLLYVFDQASFEQKAPVKVLAEGVSRIKSWSFESQQHEHYKGVTVKWRAPGKRTISKGAKSGGASAQEIYLTGKGTAKSEVKKGSTAARAEMTEFTYTDETVDDSGQIYILKKRCHSQAEAERVARAKLRELNLRQLTGSLSLVGDPDLAAGVVVTLAGFGSFDGNFIIEQASHTMNSSGYVTNITVRRVNMNY